MWEVNPTYSGSEIEARIEKVGGISLGDCRERIEILILELFSNQIQKKVTDLRCCVDVIASKDMKGL